MLFASLISRRTLPSTPYSPLLPQPSQAQRLMPFCLADILFIAQQRAVKNAGT
jgi:hypothetical protein